MTAVHILPVAVRHTLCDRQTRHEFHETSHSIPSHNTGQFTPKMKANVEPRLLSSLV